MAERNLRRQLGHHLTGTDNIYFQVEHPRRRMTICTLWLFSHRLDPTLVMAALENLCTHYPRFCLVPTHGSPWETRVWSRPQRHWKFRDNFIFHTLGNPTLACLQQYVAHQYITPFDHDKPLWEAHLISGLENKQSAFLWKVHHSMSDCSGLIKALLAATTSMDPKEEMYRQWQQQKQQSWRPRKTNNNNPYSSSSYRHRMARQKYQQLQYETAKRKFGMLWQLMMVWLLWAWSLTSLLRQQVHHEIWMMRLLVEPWLYLLTSRLPLRLFLHPTYQQQPWSYDEAQTQEKLMAWTDDLDRGDMDKAQRLLGNCTLDDVLLLVLGRTMQHTGGAMRVLVPVTFRHPTDWTMKNATTGSVLEIDLKRTSSTGDILETIHQSRMAAQRSLASYVFHHVIIERILRYFPFLMVSHWIQQRYSDLPHASMTSMEGPTAPVFFGGQEMTACFVLPSQCGKGSISVGVLTYGDKINVAILTDNHPAYLDLANSLCKTFVAEFKAVVDEALVAGNGHDGEGIDM